MAIVTDTFHGEDSGTNTVVTISEWIHKTSGTPAAGLGAAIALGAEDSAGNAEQAIQIQGYLSTVTNGSEQGVFLLRVKNSGTFMDALQITVASNTATIGSNQTTVNLWNSTAATVNAWGVATTVTLGPTTGTPVTSINGLSFRLTSASQVMDIQWSQADLRLTNSLNNGATNSVIRFDCIGAAAAIKEMWFYRISPSVAGNMRIVVFSPNSSTENLTIDAKTGNLLTLGTITFATTLVSSTTTANVCNTTATTVNAFGGASVALNIGNASAPAVFAGGIQIADAKNIILDTTTGTKIGTATSQKLGFWNVTPIVQPASANQAALSLDVDVTGADTVDKAAINTNFTNIQTLVNQLRSDLVAAGIIKGSA